MYDVVAVAGFDLFQSHGVEGRGRRPIDVAQHITVPKIQVTIFTYVFLYLMANNVAPKLSPIRGAMSNPPTF